MTAALHTKYRPHSFDEVVGQDAALTALEKVLDKDASHAFLFSGPAGTGKTTIARIVAGDVGCALKDTQEISAAVFTGVDAMRQIQEGLQYRPFGSSSNRAIILDECHRLSGNSWDSLLKSIEEPPPYVYWFLCTTNPSKVPHTIKTRCTSITLKPVPDRELTKLLNRVAKEEKLTVGPDVISTILREAKGSPRQALVFLAMCDGLKDRRAAAEVIHSAVESEPAIELCRFLMKGGSWTKAMQIVEKLADENVEGVRIVVSNYVAAVARGAKTDRDAVFALKILDAFAEPYTMSDNTAPLMLSIGRVLLSE